MVRAQLSSEAPIDSGSPITSAASGSENGLMAPVRTPTADYANSLPERMGACAIVPDHARNLGRRMDSPPCPWRSFRHAPEGPGNSANPGALSRTASELRPADPRQPDDPKAHADRDRSP